MRPDLPPEIWDYVIDCLEGDYSTLVNCMLVCKSWEPRSRYNLPTEMYFDNRDQVVQVAQDSGKLWKGPVDVCAIGSRGDKRMPIPHLRTWAAMLAGRWTRVRDLSIGDAEWRAGDMSALIFLHLSAFSSVRSLLLYDVIFPSIITLRQLICCFPNLQYLDCRNLSFLVHGTTSVASVKWPQQLSSLQLSNCEASTTDIANLFLAAGGVVHLSSLRFDHIKSPAHAPASASMQALVNAAGTSLSSLVWSLNVAYTQNRFAEATDIPCLSLAPSSNLLYVELYLYDVCDSTDYDWMLRCFSQVTSNIIRNVVINFSPEHASPVDTAVRRIGQDCCARLDEVLFTLSTFPNLENVTVRLWIDSDPIRYALARELWAQVTSQMPRLNERGNSRLWIIGDSVSTSVSEISILDQEAGFI